MKNPTDLVFLISIATMIAIWRSSWRGRLLLVPILVGYIIGFRHFADEVRRASTHGNTIHGWYSKYNSAERNYAYLWVLGYPPIVFVTVCAVGAKLPIFREKGPNQSGKSDARLPKLEDTTKCPKCHSEMQKKIARKGRFKGKTFWGCIRYPRCYGLRSEKSYGRS